MKKEKQYAVEILERYQHGRYGKRFYFGIYVPAFSKADAIEAAYETLASMTFQEINHRCVDDGMKPWEVYYQGEHERKNGKDAPIGFKLAEEFFSCKAYIEQ